MILKHLSSLSTSAVPSIVPRSLPGFKPPLPSDVGIVEEKFAKGYLPGQFDTILELAQSDKRFDLLRAPTGSGKSLIGMSLGKMMGWRTLYLVGTKNLQSQLVNDFSRSGLRSVIGHGNYPCAIEDRDRFEPICSVGVEECKYRADVNVAYNSDSVVSNYSYWIALARYSDPSTLGKFDLLILDEAHTAPDWLSKTCAVTIYRSDLQSLLSISPPNSLKDSAEWSAWAELAIQTCRDKYSEVRRLPNSGRKQYLLQHLTAIGKDLSELASVKDSDIEWIAEDERDKRRIRFTPVWGRDYAERYLYRGVKKIVLCSATISEGICRYMNIPEGKYNFIDVDSRFDPKRSPFIFISKEPKIRVDSRMSPGMERLLLNRMDNYISSRRVKKGIIHSRSYARARWITRESRHKDIMVTHGSHDSRIVINRFKKSDAPCILVSPAVEEGFDFPYDECEWQIIIKVPFLDSRDPITAARKRTDRGYSDYVTSIDIRQTAGRGMRGIDDYCETVIFDDHWSYFSKKGDFSEEFKRTFVKVKDVGEPIWDILAGK